MRVLVTRPQEDAAQIAVRLKELGHEALIAPLLSVRFHDGAELSLGGVQAILATSANAVRALAPRTSRRDIAVFAVGPQTASAAIAAGFSNVRSADGDAAQLVLAAAKWASPAKGTLLHASGADGAGRLASLLAAKGFEVRTEALYDVAAADHLPPEAALALKAGALDAALFFSPRSARVFVDCVTADGINVMPLMALCISEATVAALAPLAFAQIRVARRPNQSALLACLN